MAFQASSNVCYFSRDFSDCCPHLYCGKLKHNVSAAISSGLLQVSLVYLGIDMIQFGKVFLSLTADQIRLYFQTIICIKHAIFFLVRGA